MNQNDVLETFKPEYARKHGCAWFVWTSEHHDPDNTGGWASISGEPAFQFSRAKDLPKDVVWWTNLTKTESWALGRWAFFKHGSFLGPDWLALMGEWGQPKNLDDLKKSCSAWAEVLARLGEWLSRWSESIKEKDDKSHPKWSWGDGDLSDALADRLKLSADKNVYHQALAASFEETVDLEWPFATIQGKRKIILTLDRSSHAKNMLSSRYPVGNFGEVPLSELPSDQAKRWEWLANQTLPILVRFDDVVFKEGVQDLASLWWGKKGQQFSGGMTAPVWMTAEEAFQMSEWIDAYPSAFLRGQGWSRANDIQGWVSPYAEMSPVATNSIVQGLLLEALWRALSTPTRTPTKRIKSGVSPRMFWMRSYDKMLCFEEARRLQKQGFQVLSYGKGTVSVAFDAEKVLISDWQTVLSEGKIKAPMALCNDLVAENAYGDKSAEWFMKKENDLELFLMIDRLMFPWAGQKRSAVKPILEHAMRTLASVNQGNADWSADWKNDLKKEAKKGVQSLL